MKVVAVDVGGTTTAAGLVTASGEVLFERQRPTHDGGAGSAQRAIEELIDAVLLDGGRAACGAIGVGVPAVVDFDAGVIGDEAHNVPELAGVPLARLLAARFGMPAFVDNDVNALALAEWRFGTGRGTRSIVVLAPGTGFGSGIIADGRMLRGARGFGAELGHVPVKFDGPPCWCGGRGCLALYASGRGITEAARARAAGAGGRGLLGAAGGDVSRIDTPLVFRAAAEGEPSAAAVIDDACRALGAMIGLVINGLNPEVIVVTGGVAASFAVLETRVLAAAAEYAFKRALATTKVLIVPGDKRLSMRGAAALAFYELEKERTPA
jgi:predicted NBD/HSP70 family sugar kinase